MDAPLEETSVLEGIRGVPTDLFGSYKRSQIRGLQESSCECGEDGILHMGGISSKSLFTPGEVDSWIFLGFISSRKGGTLPNVFIHLPGVVCVL